MPAFAARSSVHGLGSWGTGRSEHDLFLAVADEPGLHEQFHVAVRVRAGHVEPGGAAFRAVAEQLLDEPVADVAGVREPDAVQLHDGPLVP